MLVADIESGALAAAPAERFDAVVVTNYLWRAAAADARRPRSADGGVLIYETFADGNESVGKPSRPDFLLRPANCSSAARGLRVVAYEDGFLDSAAALRAAHRRGARAGAAGDAARATRCRPGPMRGRAKIGRLQGTPMKPIVGSIVALVTPMHDDGSVDYAALRRLIDWHIAEGTDCIGVVGTTGESPTVIVEEHCEIIRVAVEHAAGRVPIMAGTGANSTAEAIELSRYATKVGADCTLSVVPYYNKPSQEGIYQHFRAIAEAVDMPMVLYNVPGRTVADMQPRDRAAPGAGARHRRHQGSHRQHRARGAG